MALTDVPDWTVIEDDEEEEVKRKSTATATTSSNQNKELATTTPFQEGSGEDKEEEETLVGEAYYPSNEKPKNTRVKVSRKASWMQRNEDFGGGGGGGSSGIDMDERPERQSKRFDSNHRFDSNRFDSNRRRRGADAKNDNFRRRRDESRMTTSRSSSPRSSSPPRSFQQDFRGSRVFVQGIPPTASWQDLKDHFRVAGEVVFASVSIDPKTGESKGHGLVQFETTEMAQTAIQIMRDHPMDGATLFVREDVKEGDEGATFKNKKKRPSTTSGPSWSCADDDNASSFLSDMDRTEVQSLIRARDDARRRRNYKVSDSIREELKYKFGVHIDDRLKMWWTSLDGKDVPQVIRQQKGEGRWGAAPMPEPWRQIPTTPENDACVNPDLVEGLLAQRDIARREKDFQTADALLEQARTAPDGDLLSLRIHDESRTWRIWTEEPPPKPIAPHLGPTERCLAIVEEHAPEKMEEVRALLESFPGREYNILKKLKQRYLRKPEEDQPGSLQQQPQQE